MSTPVFRLTASVVGAPTPAFVRGGATRPGQPIVRTYEWDNVVQRVTSGKEMRYAKWTWPIHHWALDFNYLYDDPDNLYALNTDTDLRTIEGLYNQMQGSFGAFFLDDPDDDATQNEFLGTGDGSTTQFQLVRTRGGFSEPMQSPASLAGGPLPVAYDNGTPQPGFTVGSTGILTFSSAPAAGHRITADFQYYFLARFEEDKQDFEKFMFELWQMRQVKFCSVKQ
jgi:uncharacterized protein (TIGR02217 family)